MSGGNIDVIAKMASANLPVSTMELTVLKTIDYSEKVKRNNGLGLYL